MDAPTKVYPDIHLRQTIEYVDMTSGWGCYHAVPMKRCSNTSVLEEDGLAEVVCLQYYFSSSVSACTYSQKLMLASTSV